ncbi:MAG: response regulator [Elusimicrobia bacterium]|nr:response regulator [Elusimicrobiota bacterium]
MSSKQGVKILVVDDEQGIREFLSFELSQQGYEVFTASNGAEALERIRTEKFSLIISDIRMPMLGGLEALEAIKRIEPDVEVIMMTGYGTIETAVEAMKKGAYDFILKPFNLEEMLTLIDKVLEKSELKVMVAVYEASKSVFSSIDLKKILPVIVKLSLNILKADDASVMLMGDDGKLSVAACSGAEGDERLQAFLEIGNRVAGRAAEWKTPIFVSGPLEKDPRFAGILSMRQIKHSIIYPLFIDNELLGILNVNRMAQDVPFGPIDLRGLTILGSQISQAVYNAKLYRRLQDKMTALEQAQAHLIQSEKLAAIGQLSAGVAHELNNPLTGILGFTQILLQDEEITAKQREDLEVIQSQSQRCRQIVQSLLQFSRKQNPHKEPLNAVQVFNSVLKFVKYDVSKAGIELISELPETLPPIWGDSSQLQQVLLNILTNAMHALEGGESKKLILRAFTKSGRVVVEVEDNGRGIPEKHLSEIFDPFFTTKPIGQGTGLGLSISFGIMQEHQGSIQVKSEEGRGAKFILDFPVYGGAEKNSSVTQPQTLNEARRA